MSFQGAACATSVIFVVLAWPANASAQPSPEGYILNRPTVSPYLNLLQTSQLGSPYQTLVWPLIEQRDEAARQSSVLQQLQQRVQSDERRSSGRGLRGTGQTGRETRFMSYSHYYNIPHR